MRPHYARIDDEGRTLLHELFATAGDIRVSNSELQITLAPLSSPHRTLAAQAPVRHPQHDSLSRLFSADAVCGPPAAPYRSCLSRLAGQAWCRMGSSRGCLTGAKPGIFARPSGGPSRTLQPI